MNDLALHALLVSSCSVDSGSPAEEAGLLVGDQVMDVNGHSFISIQHQEAVHILRSYQNLILTIKVKGYDKDHKSQFIHISFF